MPAGLIPWTNALVIVAKPSAAVQEIRDDALHMLRVLSMRVWREGLVAPRGDADTKAPFLQARQPGKGAASHEPVAVVVGNLQDTYQQFQYQVSAKLAR